MDSVFIIEMVSGYHYDKTYYRLRVVDTYDKAVDYIAINYPEFIRTSENEWVSEEPVSEDTMRIYIVMETVF